VPEPREAKASWSQLEFTLFVEWEQTQPFDIDAVVYLTDDNGNPLDDWIGEMTPDANLINWTYTFIDVPDEAVGYWINWNPGTHNWVQAPRPIEGDNPWPGTEIWVQTHCE